MTERMTKKDAWKRVSLPLTNAVAVEKGELACFDTATGLLTKGGTSTTLLPIGYFDSTGTGDGTTEFQVTLFRELWLHWWDNDDGTPVTAAHRGTQVYIKDDRTVSASSAGGTRSIAGRVWAVSSTYGVLLEMGLGVTGPTGSAGSTLLSGGVADRAALKAIAATNRVDGMLVLVRSDGSLWRFSAAAAQTQDQAIELVATPDAGTGRWLRANQAFTLRVPVDFSMADNAVIFTVPDNFVLRLTGLPFWDVSVSWTGGTASTIGIDSSVTSYTTKGDLLGGAAGDAAAALTAGIRPGTIGPKLDTPAEVQAFILVEGDQLHYGEITSAFTAGAGFACFPVSVSAPSV